jgi:hypothetical protein
MIMVKISGLLKLNNKSDGNFARVNGEESDTRSNV